MAAMVYIISRRGLGIILDGKIEVVGPGFEDLDFQGSMDLGIVVDVAGRQMQQDFEPQLVSGKSRCVRGEGLHVLQ